MKKIFIAVSIFIFSLTSFALQLSGVNISEKESIENQELILTGAGIRKKLVIDLYVASLYGKNKIESLEILDSSEPVLMQLDIVSKLVGSKEMQDAIEDGFKNSVNAETLTALRGKIDEFKNSFAQEAIQKGDNFKFLGIDNKVVAFKNGREVITIEGEEFKKGLFLIWIGNKPADKNLKEKLLGKK